LIRKKKIQKLTVKGPYVSIKSYL